MKCRQAKSHIHSFIDRELESTLQRELQAHLEVCAACRTYQSRMHDVRLMAGRAPQLKAPASLGYRVRATLGISPMKITSKWFSTLQFRLCDFSNRERFRATFLSTPITLVLFLCAALMVYSPESVQNIEHFLNKSSQNWNSYSPVQRQYLENLYEFSPEFTTTEYVCSDDKMVLENTYQPRMSIASMRMFVENDFQESDMSHLSVLTWVHSDGSTEVESISNDDLHLKRQIQNMFNTAIIFPALLNGDLVDSRVLFMFDKIEVYG